ncbi:D-alanine--D-alanine ligase [Candidatus Liberibacter sp.]|uniref:D-alanine--D-alanine ligase n=1 Tax=Candidatus Liberibacter sp. TaxID=34022 RepID=UPI0015F43DC9|nr:D-alanine--D-alanine ligase [Candidatus Liberibacter sp.]MBA5724287.1 D-alanine--D-alanine ligase [Candidatus Liberibacter sp.]
MKNRHIAVLKGGFSPERDISLSSGEVCSAVLESQGFKVSQIDVDRSVATVISDLRPDVAFNALHGNFGEDGIIQAILEYLNVPYTHSGVLASALSMDKLRAKQIVASVGVPVCPSLLVNRLTMGKEHVMPPPYVIKPLSGGSSLGILIVREEDSVPLDFLDSSDWSYGDQLLVEKYVDGIELTCGVMGEEALVVTEILPKNSDFYSYKEKYSTLGSTHILPAKIPSDVYEQIQRFSILAHKSIGCRGISRSDFRFDNVLQKIFWLEINTQPGMTPTSLFPEMVLYAGHSFETFLSWMVKEASCSR